MKYQPAFLCAIAAIVNLASGVSARADTVYNPATSFEQGWTTNSNPNGVWSYGYSSTFTSPITLYDSHFVGPDSPTEQMWISTAVNCCAASPAVGYNNGPAFNDSNVAAAANQFLFVSSVYQNLSSDLLFTAPTSGKYSLTGDFTGNQYGIGVNIGIFDNGSTVFTSSITSIGQIVPFGAMLTLSKGDILEFAVEQGGGLQNTGFDLSITTSDVPEPSTWAMMLLGFAGLGLAGYRKTKTGRATSASG